MRHLTDEELAKYFDDGTQDASASGAKSDGWSLDDAFANPKQGRTTIPAEDAVSRPHSVIPDPETPVPLKRPRLSERPMHPVRPVSRASQMPPSELQAPPAGDLTWTGRDVQPVKSGGVNKTTFLFIAALASCAIFVFMMSGGEPGTSLPQIGR